MKTGKYRDKITITVKVSVGCDEPWPPPTEDKAKLAVLQGLRATLQIIGESYESEVLGKVLAQLGEPDEYLTPPNLDLTHRPVAWHPLPPSKWGQDEVESMVKDLHGARQQLKSILDLSEEAKSAANDPILKAIHFSASSALAFVGDDK